MSKRNKLQKFAEVLALPNVFENFDPKAPHLIGQHGEEVELKGKWASDYFGNDHPITLELACGKGDYTLGLARRFPKRNFIGVDIKGARIWKGATIAHDDGLRNVAFLRTRIEQIAYFFEPGEVDEIWITFPDPFLKKSKRNRRLTAPRFLGEYKKILRNGGIVHLKTDEKRLYDFSLEVLAEFEGVEMLYQRENIYAESLDFPELEIKTFYEKMHLADGRTIKYLKFRLKWAEN